jgi:dephospho-CoA kinase
MLAAAVTGDVGAGKSTLARVWGTLGASVISADDVAKSQWSKREILEQAVSRWGDGILKNGAPYYSAIAQRAFENEEEYRFTNALVHPGTMSDIRRMTAPLRGLVVLEIPLLFESGGYDCADYVIYVTAPDDARVRRNSARGWDEGEIARRERFMSAREDKKKKSDLVLCNDGDTESWERVSLELGKMMLAMASVYELSAYCPSSADAERIAAVLLEKRLVACVNISETASRYLWKGETYRSREWRMSCKTTERALKRAFACIRENHPYELPSVTAAELFRSDPETLRWVVESCE